MTTIKTPIQMLEHWEATFPDQVYLRQSTGSNWIEYTWKEVAHRVRQVARYIQRKEYPAGSSIAIWSSNSADWFIADLAILMASHISVPIYPAQDPETAAYVIEHSEAKMLFAGEFDQAAKLSQILPDSIDTVAIRGSINECDVDMEAIIAQEQSGSGFTPRELDEVCTIIYSSGTSGVPKGVMLTFRSIAETAFSMASVFQRSICASEGDDRERLISYLPLSHAAERSHVEMSSLYLNSCVSISAGLEHFSGEMHNVRPTFFGAVPRIWYKFKEGIEAALKAQGKSIETDADRAMVRQMLGLDQSLMNITGSAPISPAVHKWYLDVGLNLRESYGMTETFANGSFWYWDEASIPGCVGKPATGVEMKLDEMGEIHFRTPSLMKGYFKNKEVTDEVLRDGWYATGDQGRLDENGNLWITGRVGSIFKTSKGKFIHPERIEQEVLKIPLVEQVIVFGHGLAQPVAVVSVTEEARESSDNDLREKFENAIGDLNSVLPAYERISALLLARDTWSIEGGELTPTLKIKRKVLEAMYAPRLGDGIEGVLIDS